MTGNFRIADETKSIIQDGAICVAAWLRTGAK